MSEPVYLLDPKTLLIGSYATRQAAADMAETYRSAKPYPHAGFDDFLPHEVVDRVREEVQTLPEAEQSFTDALQNLKTSYFLERLPAYTKNLYYALNSRPFLLQTSMGGDNVI